MSRRNLLPLDERGPLNVMFLITSMPYGGAEILLSQLVDGLDRNRFRPLIACLKDKGELGTAISDRVNFHSNLINSKYDLGVVGRLVKLFREQEVDAVVTVGAGDKMFWGRLAAKRARLPVILSAIHSTGWPDQIGRLNRMLTPITDSFVAVAKSHGEFLANEEGFPERKVAVVPNGVNIDRFAPDATTRRRVREELGISQTSKVVGIVAALRPEKNHLLFLRMAKKVAHQLPDTRFLIVGDGPEREKLELAADHNALRERVLFLGTRSDTPDLLKAMDCFCLTSHMEASPVSILEAMASGVPVVSTRVGSVHESVKQGENGYLADSGDATGLARHVFSILHNDLLHERFATEAREFVVENASVQVMIQGYGSLIEGIYQAKQERHEFSAQQLVDSYQASEALAAV